MKAFNRVMAGFLMAALIASGSAFAAQKESDQNTTTAAATETQGDAAMKKHPDKHNGPLEMLGRFQFENMAAQTISELSSQPVETVAAKLKQDRLPKVLKEYNITKETFQTSMKPKFIALVHKRVEDGSITAAQETLILEALEKQGSRHAIMEKLIQNGVTAGIITQEEADRMLSKGEEEPPAE
ncbi:hypothetical protein [Desulforegula conservatrix]|uniref:hypothetical protein n=1 Tax=Desulforegula conservatrix TaxID=153026 RepID=UPI0003F8B534|nr:hypothetical protein [Desulforegula conservatrix]